MDNLNRATTISGVSRTYDILGNTTAIGSTKSMGWDVLNRMTSFTSGSTTTDYAYRADGMRVSKASGTQSVTYGYDGQMHIEECFSDSGASSTDYATRYALGARGIDRMETTNGSGTSVGYPVYDSHGNMIATLAESGSSYSLGNQRSYDAWGGIRSGSTTGGPSPRHCAQLGHVQDDESGLVYMRARYYDASSGRFVNQDPSRNGANWFSYCDGDPVNKVDQTGKMAYLLELIVGGILALLLGTALVLDAAVIVTALIIVAIVALIIYCCLEMFRDALHGVKALPAMASTDDLLSFLTDVKASGSPGAKILASQVELDVWIAIALGGNDD